MEKVIKILMDRDDLTREEAIELIDECREQMIEEGSDEAIQDVLGLEPDYIMDILGY